MPKPIIRTEDLTKTFVLGREKVTALDRVNLTVEKGQICAVLGTSGSGKSTLLNMLAGLERPTSGAVYIGRHRIDQMTERELTLFRQKFTGFVFQSYNLIPSLTALENVAMPLMFKGVGKEEREAKALKMLRLVGLENRKNHRPSEMSGGQQQRIAIARAIVNEPKLLLLDEPTNFLDMPAIEALQKIVQDYEGTVLFVSHDRAFSDACATRILRIENRKLLAFDGNLTAWENKQAEAKSEKKIDKVLLELRLTEVISRLSLPNCSDKEELEKEFAQLIAQKRAL